jgi:hypothetical protein
MPCNCSNAGSNNGQVIHGGNGSTGTFPPPPEERPTLAEIRYLLRGYDELGVLLPDAAILTNADGEVDQIRVDTLYVNNIECLDTGCDLFGGQQGQQQLWTNTDPTTTTVGGILVGTTDLVGLNSIQVLERILYAFQPATISAFSIPFATNNDLGITVSSGTFNFSLTNALNVSSLILSYSNNGAAYANIATLQNTSTSYSATSPVITSNTPGYFVTYKLRATQTNTQYAAVEQSRTIYWWSSLQYGKGSSIGENDFRNLNVDLGSEQIRSTSSFTQNISVAAGGGYVYLFIHNTRQINSIFQGPLNVTSAFVLQGTNTIQGIPYKIYRSTEFLNDALDFTINSGPA